MKRVLIILAIDLLVILVALLILVVFTFATVLI